MTDWFGGKPAGCLHKTNTYIQVLFSKNLNISSKCFSFGVYGSEEAAFEAAKNWQYQVSTKNNLTKNRMCVIENDDAPNYLQVQLQNGHVMKCDLEDRELVEDSIWTAWKGIGKKVYYVRRRPCKKRNQEYAMFHNLLKPEYQQIDHINRDGLDNRRQNLRDGSGYVNARNKNMQKNNTSGTTGVYFDRGRWVAQIDIGNGRNKQAFHTSVYGNIEAKRLAIEQRKVWEQIYDYIV